MKLEEISKMQVEELPIDSLIPYERNNKIHDETQVNRIANSLKEFWFLQPLVVDKNNVLVVWHWRLEWAKKLWLKTAPCVRAEKLTEAQIKKYRILDNKLNESEYNLANLKAEVDSLDDFNFWDIELSTTDLFPELETPEFDEDEFWWWRWKDVSDEIWKEYTILLKFASSEEQQVMFDNLKEMWWFLDIKIL